VCLEFSLMRSSEKEDDKVYLRYRRRG